MFSRKPFYYVRMLSQASLLAVSYTSNASYSPSIRARVPGIRFKRVPEHSLHDVRNPGHGNLSSPKSRPLGTISYDIRQGALFVRKFLSHASRLSPHPPVLRAHEHIHIYDVFSLLSLFYWCMEIIACGMVVMPNPVPFALQLS